MKLLMTLLMGISIFAFSGCGETRKTRETK